MFTKDGNEQWVLVHVEVQGYKDADFPKRMFTYFFRIYDRYNVPVTSIAIFTGTDKNFRPSTFNYVFLGTENVFKYNVYKVIDQDEDELRKSNNPFAIVILTVLLALKKGKIMEEELLNLKTELVRNLFQKQIPKIKSRAIFHFVQYYVSFDNPEMSAKFDNEINLITNNHTTMGIEQFLVQRAENVGMEKGMEKGMKKGMEKGMEIKETEKNHSFVKSLLTQTDFPSERIAKIAEVTIAFVEEVRASLRQSSN